MKKIFIGIDFAKEKFDAAIIEACGLNEFGDRQFGTFTNNKKGYCQFMKWIKTQAGTYTEQEWLLCGEDTGSCSMGLSRWLYGKGLDIWIENAYVIKHSSGIQRIKTDRADASMIAEYAWRHQDKAKLFEPLSEALMQLCEVFLYRHKLVQQRVAMDARKQNKETSESSKAINFINRKSKHLMAEIDKAIKECDDMIDRIIDADAELKENYGIITSIKGVARQNGACLLIFTNNFKRFDMDARKIACYYGVAPFSKESGTSIHTPARTSHFANKLIKSLISQAAQIAKIYNPEIKDYYERLIKRGKKHSVALNNVKNKLLRIIVALVKKKVKYDPETYKFYRNRLEKQFAPG
ncbi:IS110 family transposase [uncultured Bacteroides sp.]|uniref:IS110 family transposase n=1 Tax=uncultured Bacteroides sp. TaxID=162156 RepID=UPI0025EC414D|nr:IS110 family transposase [uncultured Bacteroides sp.]